MANSQFVKFKLEGLDQIRATLRALPEETQKKVLAVAMRRAAKPLVDAAKSYASRSVRTGALRNSIGVVVRKTRSGGAYAVVGPIRGYYKAGRKLGKNSDRTGADQPANYAHLVEFGHHVGQKKSAFGKRPARGNGNRTLNFSSERWVAPKPFLRPAVVTSQGQIANEMAEGIAAGIAQAVDRIVKNPAARG